MNRPRCFNCQKFVRRLYIQVQRQGTRKMVPWGWVCENCQLRSTQLDTIATHLDVDGLKSRPDAKVLESKR